MQSGLEAHKTSLTETNEPSARVKSNKACVGYSGNCLSRSLKVPHKCGARAHVVLLSRVIHFDWKYIPLVLVVAFSRAGGRLIRVGALTGFYSTSKLRSENAHAQVFSHMQQWKECFKTHHQIHYTQTLSNSSEKPTSIAQLHAYPCSGNRCTNLRLALM